MKNFIIKMVILLLCFNLIGCAAARDKFTRKRDEKKVVPIIEIKDYESEVDIKELYRRRFTFWKYWQEDLIQYLGGNLKRQQRSYNEALVALKTLSSYLQEQKRKELEPYIKDLENIRNTINRPYLSQVEISRLRSNLGRHKRMVERFFSPTEVESWLIETF